MLKNISDYKPLKKSIVHLYKNYVLPKDDQIKAQAGGDSDIHNLTAQRKFLQKSLDNVTIKPEKSKGTLEQSNKKIIKENVILL